MRWNALLLFLALLPHRWFGRSLAARTAVPTELVGAAVWVTAVTAVFLLGSPTSGLVRFGPLSWTRVGLGIASGAALFVVGAMGYVASESLLGLSRPVAAGAFGSVRGVRQVAALAAALLAVAVSEEVAFRAVLLGALRGLGGPVLAVGLSAAAFALYHLSAYQAVSTFVYGLILAGLTIWTGGLWPAVIAHLTLNGLGVFLSALSGTGTGA